MHTKHVEYLLPDYVTGKLDEPLRSGVSSHLDECDWCRAELETLHGAFRLIDDSGPDGPSNTYFAGILPRVRERLEQKESITTLVGPIVTRFALPLTAGALAVLLLLHVPGPKSNGELSQNPLRPVLSGVGSDELVEIALDQLDHQSFPGTLGDTETSAMLAAPILRGEYLLSGVDSPPMLEGPVLGDDIAEDLESLSDADLDALVARLSERTSL